MFGKGRASITVGFDILELGEVELLAISGYLRRTRSTLSGASASQIWPVRSLEKGVCRMSLRGTFVLKGPKKDEEMERSR